MFHGRLLVHLVQRVLWDLKENLVRLVILAPLVLLDHQVYPVKRVCQALLDHVVPLVYLVKLVSLDKQEIVVVPVIQVHLVVQEDLVKMDYQETKVIVVSLVCLACV